MIVNKLEKVGRDVRDGLLSAAVVAVATPEYFTTGLTSVTEAHGKYRTAVRQYRALNDHLNKRSKPIATAHDSNGQTNASEEAAVLKSLLFKLPTHIRQRIYAYLSPAEDIIQPYPDLPGRPIRMYHGPRPEHWLPQQRIRTAQESASNALMVMVREGSKWYDPTPSTRSGRAKQRLILGDEPLQTEQRPGRRETREAFMRTCRRAYKEMLSHTYANNTFSFFGAEGLFCFARTVSPEGIALIKNVHVALLIRIELGPKVFEQSRKMAKKAIHILATQFSSLECLDVEVVFYWTQPADPDRCIRWLRDELFVGGWDLVKFNLTVVVYDRYGSEVDRLWRYGAPFMRPLDGWDDDNLQVLKEQIESAPPGYRA